MEELRPEDLEELVQELEGEYSAPEPLPPELEEHLRALESGTLPFVGRHAAEELGSVRTSSLRIVRALETAAKSHPSQSVRSAAAKALRAPVHQEVLRQRPKLMKPPRRRGAQTSALEPISAPSHLRVESTSDPLRVSWRPPLSRQARAAVPPLFGLIASIVSLLAFRFIPLSLVAVVAIASAYWFIAIVANATRVTARWNEWVFQRGPLPLPDPHFYLRSRQLDPAACTLVWTDRAGSWGRSSDDRRSVGETTHFDESVQLQGCLWSLGILPAISRVWREQFIVTYALYARTRDGADKVLLWSLAREEAEYLEHQLQRLLDAGGGPQAEE